MYYLANISTLWSGKHQKSLQVEFHSKKNYIQFIPNIEIMGNKLDIPFTSVHSTHDHQEIARAEFQIAFWFWV